MVVDIYNTDRKFQILYTDPPWKQTKGGLRKARPNQGKELDYQTITLEEITEIQRHVTENVMDDTHTIFMWTIDKYLYESEKMLTDMGYRLHARMIWDKTNGIAPAFTVRYAHEYLLWFYKPKMIPINEHFRGKYTTVFREQATKHSKKPECVYQFIEKHGKGLF
jgi:N6-adenosine-specific RNA methylase IME4